MSSQIVRAYLAAKGFEDRIEVHSTVIDTVAHAAQAIGCSEAEIAKTLSFGVRMPPVLVVTAGDRRVSSRKFKAHFGIKPYMLPREEVEATIGHAPGGVCPFAVREGVPVWIDVSLKAFDVVHPAGGDAFTSVRMTPDELFAAAGAAGWCDVAKEEGEE